MRVGIGGPISMPVGAPNVPVVPARFREMKGKRWLGWDAAWEWGFEGARRSLLGADQAATRPDFRGLRSHFLDPRWVGLDFVATANEAPERSEGPGPQRLGGPTQRPFRRLGPGPSRPE